MKRSPVNRAPRQLRPLLIAVGMVAASLIVPATALALPDAAWIERQTMRVFLPVALWMALAWTVTRPHFFRRAVGEATPGALGAIRALVLGRLLFMVLGERLATLAAIPPTLRRPMGVMQLLFALPLGIEHLVQS